MSESRTIVVVDDNEGFLALARDVCDEVGDFITRTFESPVSALEFFQANDAAVLIVDYEMPEMTGIELAKAVHAIRPETVTMMVTGHAEQDLAIDALNLGYVYRFLRKPIDNDLFAAAVESASRYSNGLADARDLLARGGSSTPNPQAVEALKRRLRENDAEFQVLAHESQKYLDRQKADFRRMTRALIRVIEFRNPDLYESGCWVARFLSPMGPALGLPESEVCHLQIAALLKNVGLAFMGDRLVTRDPRMMEERELAQFCLHPSHGESLLSALPGFAVVARIVGELLERYDGSGPQGRAGEEISLAGQLLSIANDVYVVLSGEHEAIRHHPSYSKNYIRNHIERKTGSWYEARVARAAMERIQDLDPTVLRDRKAA